MANASCLALMIRRSGSGMPRQAPLLASWKVTLTMSPPSHSPRMASASCLALMIRRSGSGMPRQAPLLLAPWKVTLAMSPLSHSPRMAGASFLALETGRYGSGMPRQAPLFLTLPLGSQIPPHWTTVGFSVQMQNYFFGYLPHTKLDFGGPETKLLLP